MRFSSARMPCFHPSSWLVSTKLVVARLADRTRVPQRERLHLAAHARAGRPGERHAPAAPLRGRRLRRAARAVGARAGPLLGRARRRPRDRVLAAVDVCPRRLARPGVDDMVQRRPGERRTRLPAPLRGRAPRRRGARRPLRGRSTRVAHLRGGIAPGDAARRGARRARGRRRRPRRDLHADVAGRGDRRARVRARRRDPRADLLRLRGACDRVAARGLAGEGRDLRRLVTAARKADRDGRDAHRGGPACARARDRVAAGRARMAGARDTAAGHARPGRGRLRGAVSARVHVGDDRSPERREPRHRGLPRLDRARGRLPGRREARRPGSLRNGHGLDHGPVDGRRRQAPPARRSSSPRARPTGPKTACGRSSSRSA